MLSVTEASGFCQSPPGALTRENISREFGQWLDGMSSWEWYATLTFRDPENPRYPGWSRVGWKFAHKALESLNSALISNLSDNPPENPVWVACMELQERGVPHWHALVSNVGNQRRMGWVDWWFEHYGIARILPYQQELGARYYLGKYLTKQISDIRFSPALAAQLRRKSQAAPGMVSL
jgi:hypothetical protein